MAVLVAEDARGSKLGVWRHSVRNTLRSHWVWFFVLSVSFCADGENEGGKPKRSAKNGNCVLMIPW